MQTEEINYLDKEFTVSSSIPSTLAEMLPLLGTEEDVIAEAVDNLFYRNKYPRVYAAVSAEVEKLGFAKAVVSTETKADGTVKEVKESDNNHLRAFWKGRKYADTVDSEGVKVPGAFIAADEANKATLLQLFIKHDALEPLYVKGERTGGGGKISAEALALANSYIADGKVAKVVDYIEATVPGYKVGRDTSGNPTPESLARAIMALQKKAEADAKAAAKAGLGAL